MDAPARNELEATVAARRELGPEHEDHLIEGFIERMESEIDRQVNDRLRHIRRGAAGGTVGPAELGVFVPIFIVGGIFGGAVGIAAVAAALVIVFLVQTFQGGVRR